MFTGQGLGSDQGPFREPPPNNLQSCHPTKRLPSRRWGLATQRSRIRPPNDEHEDEHEHEHEHEKPAPDEKIGPRRKKKRETFEHSLVRPVYIIG